MMNADLTQEEEKSALDNEAESGRAGHVSVEPLIGVNKGAPHFEEHLHSVNEEENNDEKGQRRETCFRNAHPILLA